MARILVIDDRPASRELERIMLESFGYEVMEAGSGREALAAASRALPDLVLLDLHMPELDGFSTLAEFRSDSRMTVIPIVALTASAMKGDHMRALQAGFSGYITKPVFVHEFRSQIRRFSIPTEQTLVRRRPCVGAFHAACLAQFAI